MRSPRPRRRDDEGGAIAVMAAILVMAVLAAGALAVDVGRVAYVSRDQQGATDRATLDSLAPVTQVSVGTQNGTQLLNEVHDVAAASLARNLGSSGGTSHDRILERVSLGRMGEDGYVEACGADYDAAGNRVATSPECEDPLDELGISAVQLRTTSDVDYILALGELRGTEVTKSAVATSEAIGAISAASVTAAIDGGILNHLLTALTQGDDEDVVDLELIGHEGVADVSLTLADLLRSERLSIGTVDELLDAEITALDLLHITADALRAGEGDQEDPAAAALVAGLDELIDAGVAAHLEPIQLGYVPDPDPDDPDVSGEGFLDVATNTQSGADIAVNAIEFVTAGLQLANRDHAVDLEADVFGALPITLTVIEPPVIAIGPPGKLGGQWRTAARTSQLELAIGLPLGAGAGADEASAAAQVQAYRDRLGDAEGYLRCSRRVGIVEDIEDDLQAIADGSYSSDLISGLVSGLVDGLLGGIGDLLGCVGGSPTVDDVAELIDQFEEIVMVEGFARELDGGGSETHQLTVSLGRGEVRLEELNCGDSMSALLNAASETTEVTLPETTIVDLSPVARASVGLDVSLAGVAGAQAWVDAPYPSDPPARFSAQELDLAGALAGLEPQVEVLGVLQADLITDFVLGTAEPLLSGLDSTLMPLTDLLGVDLGIVEGRVLDAECTGRRLVE